ncbi:MAG: type II toxin-antitoxin system death-on-curing family toxin [Burkholderiaceae bacterium]|nr:type II toxin-antitoxin system death-on-curing family toxin [Burkholderiaceae bacterium]
MTSPVWVLKSVVLAIHNRQLSEHGGQPGVRDEGLLISALARAENLHVYAPENASLPALAAAYAFGIAKNHPFLDGNKRTALVVSLLFLQLNGYSISAGKEDRYRVFYGVAAGTISEEELTTWLAEHLIPHKQ